MVFTKYILESTSFLLFLALLCMCVHVCMCVTRLCEDVHAAVCTCVRRVGLTSPSSGWPVSFSALLVEAESLSEPWVYPHGQPSSLTCSRNPLSPSPDCWNWRSSMSTGYLCRCLHLSVRVLTTGPSLQSNQQYLYHLEPRTATILKEMCKKQTTEI